MGAVTAEHALIAPSSIARVVQCPGSVTLSRPFLPEPATEESLEGDAADYVTQVLRGGGVVTEDDLAPNEVPITEEMIEGAQLWNEALGAAAGFQQRRVNIKRVHPTECWGTPDFYRWDDPGMLFVADYKFGHRYVEVFENWQLMAYAAGILEEAKRSDLDVKIRFLIVQPRWFGGNDKVREWTVDASDIRAFVNRMNMAAEEALGDDPYTTTGPECEFCPARHACKTLQKRVGALIDLAGKPEVSLHEPASLGQELRMLDAALARMEARRTGLAAQALALSQQGRSIPHYKTEPSMGREQWTAPPEEIITIAEMMGIDVRKKQEVITPAQARKLGFDESVSSMYVARKAGALKLVPDNTTKARRIFNGK